MADDALPLRNRRIRRVEPLVTPEFLSAELPLDAGAAVVAQGRTDVSSILRHEDDRLIVIVGPCSVHDTDAALEYAERLAASARELASDLLVVMRVYFEKPRTTTGWKGLINDPHLDGSGDVNTGLRRARRLLLDILAFGLPAGCEFLDPIIPQYIADTVSWAAIGARTVESQVHRQLASGLSMPVGFKNRTDGNVAVAADAVHAAATPHAFTGVDDAGVPAIFFTEGNEDCHVILRGGSYVPNHTYNEVNDALGILRSSGLRERLIIDASHGNSRKDHRRQPQVARSIGEQVAWGERAIVGIMLESFLVEGRQELAAGMDLVRGQSITDACMSWETTHDLLVELAASVRERRAAPVAAQSR
jgi:3-deoxy-7-phosphoheptulonate synthase